MASAMGEDRPCIKCKFYGGIAWRGPHTFCFRDVRMVIGSPQHGCAYFERAYDSVEERVERFRKRRGSAR